MLFDIDNYDPTFGIKVVDSVEHTEEERKEFLKKPLEERKRIAKELSDKHIKSIEEAERKEAIDFLKLLVINVDGVKNV